MHQIRVASPPESLSEHPSAQAAFKAAKQENASWLKKTGAERLFGQQIDSASWTDRTVTIVLDSGAVIAIGCNPQGVIYEVIGSDAHSSDQQSRSEHLPVEVDLLFGSGVAHWNRGSMASDLIGRRLIRVFMSDRMLFLYASGLPIYLITVLKNLDTEELLLYWTETD
jgi:hypothetical protein